MRVKEVGESEGCIVTMQIQTRVWRTSQVSPPRSAMAVLALLKHWALNTDRLVATESEVTSIVSMGEEVDSHFLRLEQVCCAGHLLSCG